MSTDSNLGNAIESSGQPKPSPVLKPFHRPFQYVGLSVSKAAELVDQVPNEVGNIIIDTEDCHMLLEAEGNFIIYVDIELKKTAPHL